MQQKRGLENKTILCPPINNNYVFYCLQAEEARIDDLRKYLNIKGTRRLPEQKYRRAK